MKAIFIILALVSSSAWAINFQAEKDHCKAGEFKPVHPLSGATGGGGLDASAWAETGYCIKMPMEQLLNATDDINVMTWTGVTRVPSRQVVKVKKPNEFFDIIMTYEAYHKHLWCQSAQWPVEWTGSVVDGNLASPNRALIVARRVPGGDSNGSFVKKMDMLIELLRGPSGETSVHARWEVKAPTEGAADALAAINQYLDRLTTVASGKKARGATPDPECPYNKFGLPFELPQN